jgi:hypothetical protein
LVLLIGLVFYGVFNDTDRTDLADLGRWLTLSSACVFAYTVYKTISIRAMERSAAAALEQTHRHARYLQQLPFTITQTEAVVQAQQEQLRRQQLAVQVTLIPALLHIFSISFVKY